MSQRSSISEEEEQEEEVSHAVSSEIAHAERKSLAAVMMAGVGGGKNKRSSIAAAASASAASAAASAQRDAQNRKLQMTSGMPRPRGSKTGIEIGSRVSRLESEVSQEEAESMFTYVQTKSAALQIFTESEIPTLVRFFSVLRFAEGQTLMARGEPGSHSARALTLRPVPSSHRRSLNYTRAAGARRAGHVVWHCALPGITPRTHSPLHGVRSSH
jgi:hypothetical protein